ncbi:MAG: MoaD/ThiS family protein [Planctomycetota bacterium]
MTITVALFAAAREIVGSESIQLQLDDDATVETVKQLLIDRFPELLPLVGVSSWSMDHEYVSPSEQLRDGAELGFIPPVSGG